MKKRIAIICIGFLVAVTSVVLLCLSMQSSKPSHWVIQEMKTKLQADYIEYVSEEYRRELGKGGRGRAYILNVLIMRRKQPRSRSEELARRRSVTGPARHDDQERQTGSGL